MVRFDRRTLSPVTGENRTRSRYTSGGRQLVNWFVTNTRYHDGTTTVALRIPLLPRPLRWLPAIVVASQICYWSLLTTPPTGLPLAAPPGPTATSGIGFGLEGIGSRSGRRHVIAYATLALTLAYAFAGRDAPIVHKALFVFAIATGYGALLEGGQLFRPDRVASLTDVAANAIGAAFALSWYGLEHRARVVPVPEYTRHDGA